MKGYKKNSSIPTNGIAGSNSIVSKQIDEEEEYELEMEAARLAYLEKLQGEKKSLHNKNIDIDKTSMDTDEENERSDNGKIQTQTQETQDTHAKEK